MWPQCLHCFDYCQDFYKLLADLLGWLANAEQAVATRDPPVRDHKAIERDIIKLKVSKAVGRRCQIMLSNFFLLIPVANLCPDEKCCLFCIIWQTLQNEQKSEKWPGFEDMVKAQCRLADLAASRKNDEDSDRAEHAKAEVDKVKVW